MKTEYNTIAAYNKGQIGEDKKICATLKKEIDGVLPTATSKIWHGAPVWFLDENPVVGYSKRKAGVTVLFWSGQSFTEKGLSKEGSFKAAQVVYVQAADIRVTQLRKWLREAKRVQWDYKNIVKHKGKLVRLGSREKN
jgi:hypothetical protein